MNMNLDKPHILIVDDDKRILKLLQQFLQKNGYLVSSSSSAMEAMEYLRYYELDLLIIDVMMPEITGIEFAKKVKTSIKNMPIILLTALSESEDKIKGLETKADDYVTKPFDPRELILRIKNLINLYSHYNKSHNIVKIGHGIYNLSTKKFNKNNETIILSSTEQKLLEILIKFANQPIDRNTISNFMGCLNNRSVDVQIIRLRNKIENDPKNPQFLQTIRNQGYILYI